MLALGLFAFGCAQKDAEVHAQNSQSLPPKGTLLVKQLPAGVEGVELKDGWLHLKEGYKFEKQPRHRFSVARIGGGHGVTSGGCGCTGGTCDPKLGTGGIIVCDSTGCTGSCGLALTIGGAQTKIIRY
jgi:hypothetical protein